MSARPQLLGQREEGFGVSGEVSDVENGRGLWDVVLLQVVIETGPWGPVVGDIGGVWWEIKTISRTL